MSNNLPLFKRLPLQLLCAYLAFVTYGSLLAMLTPLGEGFDEPWHLAYVQFVAQAHDVPRGQSALVSKEISTFIETHPASWSLHEKIPSLTSYEEYWAGLDRPERNQALAELRFSGVYTEVPGVWQYEGHQPPLYYVIASPLFALASRHLSLVDTFLLLRMLSVLLASLAVPPAFMLAKLVFDDDRAAGMVAAFMPLLPGIYTGVIRVSNDALALSLACWTFWAVISYLKRQQPSSLCWLTALMLAGLWTKAFFLPIAVGVLGVFVLYRHFRGVVSAVLAAALALPWFLHNLQQVGSFTGLPETRTAGTSVVRSIGVFWDIDWVNVFMVTAGSHVWAGNWSFVGLRPWMYNVIIGLFVFVILGLARPLKRLDRAVFALLSIYGAFVVSLAYLATRVYQSSGIAVAEGWYLTPLVPVEAVLFVAGARGWTPTRWSILVRAMQVFLVALLLYSTFFLAMPYYAGFREHGATGMLTTYHPTMGSLLSMPGLLLRFHPWIPPVVPWLLLGTFLILAGYLIGGRNKH